MIVSHQLRFAFFNTPKTGSTTASAVLVDNGLSVTEVKIHTTPSQAIALGVITLEQLREYKCYAFFRDPYARHFSAKSHGLTDEEEQIQTDFFYVDGEMVVEPLDFDSYEPELRKMLAVIGVNAKNIPNMNQRDRKWTEKEFWTDDYRQQFKKQYADDIKFCETIRG